MTADRDFEGQLFDLYGEPSSAFEDGSLTERVLREIRLDNRLRAALQTMAVMLGVGLAALALAMFGTPLIAQTAAMAGSSPLAVWAALLAGAVLLGVAAARMAPDA